MLVFNAYHGCIAVLAGGFAEDRGVIDPASLNLTTENYDYESDSDLEDLQEVDDDDIKVTPSSVVSDTAAATGEANESQVSSGSLFAIRMVLNITSILQR